MNRRLIILIAFISLLSGCVYEADVEQKPVPYFVVLGTTQDAGSPQIGCEKDCCKNLFNHPDYTRKVVSIGIVDPEENKTFIIEATPDLPSQMHHLNEIAGFNSGKIPDGIFLTHAHTGHYTGLKHFGKEAMNANLIEVFAMKRMKAFLEQNGPWSQLVANENININSMVNEKAIELTKNISITPVLVPHRDEYSETVGFTVTGKENNVLFIPDIDKWDKWHKSIIAEIRKVDYVFIDATFYDGKEINNRDISEIPHPFVIESMELFKDLSQRDKAKIHFIHFNHTNPLLNHTSDEYATVKKNGYNIARYGDRYEL